MIIDGVPPKLELCEEDIMKQLRRRRPGQSVVTTPVSNRLYTAVFNINFYG